MPLRLEFKLPIMSGAILLPVYRYSREDLVRRFALEERAASGLNHPNIVTVYEIGKTGSSEYIATEYIEGETLRQHFARGRMGLREVLDVVIQVAGALAHGAPALAAAYARAPAR